MPLRHQFRKTRKGQEAQKQMAKEELEHWLTYVERRKEQCESMPETRIDDSAKRLLRESFDRMRSRDTQRVAATDVTDAHATFAKGYTFRVPINPRNLSQLIHPHQGYMASMPDRGYTWEEMLQTYEIQVVSSYEKSKGRTLHGEELSALSMWLLADTEK